MTKKELIEAVLKYVDKEKHESVFKYINLMEKCGCLITRIDSTTIYYFDRHENKRVWPISLID